MITTERASLASRPTVSGLGTRSEQFEATRRRRDRLVLGLALVMRALGHAAVLISAGARITERGSLLTAQQDHTKLWIAAVLAAITMTGLLAAAFGVLGARGFRSWWRSAALIGLGASVALLLLFTPAGTLVGLVIDLALLTAVVAARKTANLGAEPAAQRPVKPVRVALLYAVLVYVGLAAGLQPVFLRWGTHPEEVYRPLPGDRLPPGKGFQILHAVTIDARPEQVWPWLAQIGQDRGGFYSYAGLENLLGLRIANAREIVPQWQSRHVGDKVPATPPHWLGLIDQPLGWRVLQFEAGHVLVLENWGAFALVPINDRSTRFYIRTQGPAGAHPSPIWSPVEVFIFQPAHFIMQRRMMLGIKDRAEQLPHELPDLWQAEMEE